MSTIVLIAAGLVVLAMYLVYLFFKTIWWILDVFLDEEKVFPVFMIVLVVIVIAVAALISSI